MAFQSTPPSLSLHAHGKVESRSHRCLNRFLPDCLSHVSRGGKSQSSIGERVGFLPRTEYGRKYSLEVVFKSNLRKNISERKALNWGSFVTFFLFFVANCHGVVQYLHIRSGRAITGPGAHCSLLGEQNKGRKFQREVMTARISTCVCLRL